MSELTTELNMANTIDLSHHQLQKWEIKRAAQILRGNLKLDYDIGERKYIPRKNPDMNKSDLNLLF